MIENHCLKAKRDWEEGEEVMGNKGRKALNQGLPLENEN